MCGIVGYIGAKKASNVLVDGLRRLEYRGYDSAGIAVLNGDLQVIRMVGKVSMLEGVLGEHGPNGRTGIAHTRWATHGPPSEENAHPHRDCAGRIALVHNGIIEDYAVHKERLERAGHVFRSQADTEVLAHLIEEARARGMNLPSAVRAALAQVRGTYGLAVVSVDAPDTIVAARLGSPLVIGIGDGELILASDPSAVVPYTRKTVYLEDGELAVLTGDGYHVYSLENRPVEKTVEELDWSTADAERGGHAHFMLKEMLEQPQVLTDVLRGRLDLEHGTAVLGGLRDVAARTRQLERLIVVGCGSAYYAGLIGEHLIETLARVPVEVELASEFRYRNPIITPRTAVLAVSQSGETADTLAAVREAKRHGALALGIVNAVGSSIARETDAGVYTHAGPEIGVASTKAFVSQMAVFALLALHLARERGLPESDGRAFARALCDIPAQAASILSQREHVRALAARYADATHALYLGRRLSSVVAYEGALKLKEVSYVHAEGYAAGEMKHGPIALAEPSMPVIAICPTDSVYEKTRSNIEEVRARRSPILAIATEGNEEIRRLANDVIFVPATHELLTPFLTAVPLQMLAYEIAVARGLNPDQPRNLAKAVTVE